MHEWSQTANLVDWKSLPYEYASADATPAVPNGDQRLPAHQRRPGFRAANWDALARAWKFQSTHDSDGDGIYDNSQGTGWVESWVPACRIRKSIWRHSMSRPAWLSRISPAPPVTTNSLSRRSSRRAHPRADRKRILPSTSDFLCLQLEPEQHEPTTPQPSFPRLPGGTGRTRSITAIDDEPLGFG